MSAMKKEAWRNHHSIIGKWQWYWTVLGSKENLYQWRKLYTSRCHFIRALQLGWKARISQLLNCRGKFQKWKEPFFNAYMLVQCVYRFCLIQARCKPSSCYSIILASWHNFSVVKRKNQHLHTTLSFLHSCPYFGNYDLCYQYQLHRSWHAKVHVLIPIYARINYSPAK